MNTSAIIDEISKLPLNEKLFVVDKTLEVIRREKSETLQLAATQLYQDYKSDKELTAFTLLDPEAFYEAK